MLDVRASQYLAVNGSGTVLWGALKDGATQEALIDRLVDRFELTRDHAARDVEAFLAVLRRHELLEA